MAGHLRVLNEADKPRVLELLERRPLENLFVIARVLTFGVDPAKLGCQIWGFEQDGELVSLCHAGTNLFPVAADDEALEAYAAKAGPWRNSTSILGESSQVQGLWQRLSDRWGKRWSEARDVRLHQPLMVIDSEPLVPPDPRVQQVSISDFTGYFDAALKMYVEEVGVSPLDSSGSYQSYVRLLIQNGRAFGAVHDHKVWFKSDIGSSAGQFCQVQGVWLDPALRGRGMAGPAMASVVNLCRQWYPVVSLYVNDFNERAIKLYQRVGFRTVGELATILY